MHILIITTNGITQEFDSWPERLQARALAQRGHKVRAYTYLGKKSWNKEQHEVIDEVEVKRLRRRQWLSLDLIKALWRDPRPDVVHLHHLSNQFSFLTVLLCKLRRIPVVMTPHGLFHDPWLVFDRDRPFDSPARYDDILQTIPQMLKALLFRFKPKRALKNYLMHAPLRQVNKVIALSEHGRGVLLKLGLKAEKITIIPNAIDPDWFEAVEPAPKSHDELRILYLGQLKYRKGFDLLAKAILPVVQRFPQARFVFATHSPIHRDDLLEIVDKAGVRGYIQLPEHVSDSEKAALFLGSDLYVLPTRYEGFGIPILEAMSAGCPVISTNIPVIDEIIKDELNGLLFEYDNPQSLAEAIIQALENPLLRHKLAENGRREVEKYYTAKIVEQLEAVYREVCGKPTPAVPPA